MLAAFYEGRRGEEEACMIENLPHSLALAPTRALDPLLLVLVVVGTKPASRRVLIAAVWFFFLLSLGSVSAAAVA